MTVTVDPASSWSNCRPLPVPVDAMLVSDTALPEMAVAKTMPTPPTVTSAMDTVAPVSMLLKWRDPEIVIPEMTMLE